MSAIEKTSVAVYVLLSVYTYKPLIKFDLFIIAA